MNFLVLRGTPDAQAMWIIKHNISMIIQPNAYIIIKIYILL